MTSALRRPVVRAAALTAALLCPIVLPSPDLRAQTTSPSPPASAPRFAVASVKPNATTNEDIVRALSAGSAPGMAPAGIRPSTRNRFVATRVHLRALVVRAYGLRDYQLEGGPEWMTNRYFDIDARADENATDEQLNLMLRGLLADRFALKSRMETRQMPVQVLTLARSDGRPGSSLKPASAACIAELEERRRTNTPVPPLRPTPVQAEAMAELLRTPRCGATNVTTSFNGGATLASGGMAISALIERISTELASPVVDRTGLTGLYDYVLEYETARARPTPPPGAGASSRLEGRFPPLKEALQRQLGLKLETEQGPVQVLVIESAELPQPD